MAPSVRAALSLGLVASATAIPTQPVLEPRQEVKAANFTDPEEMCENKDVDSLEKAWEVWNNRGAGALLDVFLESSIDPPNEDWVAKIADKYLPLSGDTWSNDCAIMGGTCHPPIDCEEMVAEGTGQVYWILNAVMRLQTHMEIMRDSLTMNVLNSSLDIDDIVSDFSRPPDSLIPDALAFALGMASAAIGFGAGGIGFASLGWSGTAVAPALLEGAYVARMFKEDDSGDGAVIEADDLAGALQQMFTAIYDRLRVQLALAVGAKSSKSSDTVSRIANGLEGKITTLLADASPEDLPVMGGRVNGEDWDSPISSFFANGAWLLSETAFSYDSAFDQVWSHLSMKLVDTALNETYYRVIGDPGVDESDCGQHTQIWMSDIEGGMCFGLMYANTGRSYSCKNDESHRWGDHEKCSYIWPSDDEVSKITDKWGFDLETYYRDAYECNRVNGNHGGEFDPTDTTMYKEDGSLPTCFWRMAAKNATIWSDSHKDNNIGSQDAVWCSDCWFDFN